MNNDGDADAAHLEVLIVDDRATGLVANPLYHQRHKRHRVGTWALATYIVICGVGGVRFKPQFIIAVCLALIVLVVVVAFAVECYRIVDTLPAWALSRTLLAGYGSALSMRAGSATRTITRPAFPNEHGCRRRSSSSSR